MSKASHLNAYPNCKLCEMVQKTKELYEQRLKGDDSSGNPANT